MNPVSRMVLPGDQDDGLRRMMACLRTFLRIGADPHARLGRSLALPRIDSIGEAPEFLATLKAGVEGYP